MAWDDHARTDLAADKALRTGRAEWLADRNRMLGEKPLQHYNADTTTNSVTGVTLFTFDHWVPDYADGWYLHAIFEAYITPAGAGNIRVNATNTGALSTNITNGSPHADAPEISVLIDSGEINSLVTFTVVGKVGNGANTLHVRNGTNINTGTRHTIWFEQTA